MTCLPLIERELRVALRKQRPARGRLKVAAGGVGGSMFFLLLASLTRNAIGGQALEKLLCAAGLYFVFRAPMLTAGVLAEERRNQTLGLLFLSGLGAGEVFASKFLSSTLVAFTNLLAIFPLLALPFLIGGVSYDLFLGIIAALPVLMLFALAVSLLASVLTREDGSALVLANVIGGLLCLLPLAIYFAYSYFLPLPPRFSPWWVRLCPAYGPYLVWNGFESGFGAAQRVEFRQNLAVTLGWSALALGLAAFALRRLWREQEEMVETSGWRKVWHSFVNGSRQDRARLGRLWLDDKPFVWLASRSRQPRVRGWGVVSGIVLAWLLCWAVWRAQWLSVPNFFFTATLLNGVLVWLTRQAAAQEIGLARRDGVYELLLTTPLSPEDIVQCELESLRLHFRGLANFVFWLEVMMMLGGLAVRQWNRGALLVYFLIWVVLLAWTWSLGRRMSHVLPVMWASLNCGRPARALLRASGFTGRWTWLWLLNAYNMRGAGIFRGFPSGSGLQVAFVLFMGFIIATAWLLSRLLADQGYVPEFKWDPKAKVWVPMASVFKNRDGHYGRRLIAEFREIVREPLPDPSDPRYKKWNARERFPWGWEMVQQQLHERLARKSERV